MQVPLRTLSTGAAGTPTARQASPQFLRRSRADETRVDRAANRLGRPGLHGEEGEDVSPPLAWEGVPEGAKSLVLIIDDPDAPDPKAPKMVWVHWVVYNMPPDIKSLPENAGKE